MAKILFAYKFSFGNPAMMIMMVLLVLVLHGFVAEGMALDLWAGFKGLIPTTETDCNRNGEVETLCQRCAKQTKSNVVYPMCCNDTEEAREWCQKYLNFGLQ